MGPQRILQAAVVVVVGVVAGLPPAVAAPRERIALIDLGLGPDDPARDQLDAAITVAGLERVRGDGVEEALAGRAVERDELELAAALASAQRAFGALACGEVTPASQQAIGIAAARQAAGRPVPELARAWTYVLLCADRDGRLDAAHAAADQLRALGAGSSSQVPAAVWARYPEIDAIGDRELVELDLDADVPGAAIWIDHRKVGVAPLHVALPAGEHVIAAASGQKRGWAAGTAIAKQKSLRVPLADVSGPWTELAQRIAGWHGQTPAPAELAWVLARVHARIALIRHGDTIEAWGQIGSAEAPRAIGAGAAPLGEASRVLALVVDRARSWTEHAPDPDRPLLVDSSAEPRRARSDPAERPTKWWVYAAIAGAAAISVGAIYLHDSAGDRQRVELHYPPGGRSESAPLQVGP
jgi:hypothetical protein